MDCENPQNKSLTTTKKQTRITSTKSAASLTQRIIKMALKITANADHVVQLAFDYGRLDNFGYKGWRLLAEAMENLSDDIGEDIEVDIIGWCCEYSHATSADEVFEGLRHHYYGWDIEGVEWDAMDDEEKLEAVQRFLHESTHLSVCEHDCIIWASF